ncbi:hypothetical protein BLA60_14835 [Actinophytocola xinjiangensis]|uniref:Uncharacterized protein n=1 Tax=Actinophytocola xinjiangensis TaxID=485602 RepID=A0A7Z1AXJ9_9PSEU|nr:hypothetical protein [Actinophytocola xinjiangensis]OLF10474.1 hypothetical protein BLA60_14835 [Actinophytocola xinjiangensis]
MPNEDWQVICQRGRALREAEGTLSGQAAGDEQVPALDHSAAVRAIGTGAAPQPARSAGVPDPLASVVDHLDELGDEAPEFVSNADLAELLDFDPAWLGRRLAELGCRSTRERVTSEDGRVRQARGYLTADLFTAADDVRDLGGAL